MSSINFDKYITSKPIATPKTALNFDKYIVNKPVVGAKPVIPQGKIVEKTLKGGGTFKLKVGDPNALIKTERSTYGGVPTKKGFERADVVPVSLGGVNSSPANIQYEKYPVTEKVREFLNESILGRQYVPKTSTDKFILNELLPKYKSGQISLREAQAKAVSYLSDEQQGLKKTVAGNLLAGLKEAPSQIFSSIKKKLEPEKTFTFDVGAGLSPEQAKMAQAEARKEPVVPIKKPILEQYGEDVKQAAKDEAFLRSKKLGLVKSTPATNLREAKIKEARVQKTAEAVTAPVRWTAGSLASVATSGALEYAGVDKTYKPKTDAEKLLIGENEIKRLSKSDDLYGQIAKTSVPLAIIAGAFLENPFIAGTGIGPAIKAGVKKAVVKQGLKVVEKKIAKEELVTLAEKALDDMAQTGKMTPEQVGQAVAEVEKFKGAIAKSEAPKIEPKVEVQPKADEILPEPVKIAPVGKIEPITPTVKTMKTADLVSIKRDGGFRTPEEALNLEKSIADEGIKEPIVLVKKPDNTFVLDNGNKRIGVAEKQGIKDVPVAIYQQSKNGESIKLDGDDYDKAVEDYKKQYAKKPEPIKSDFDEVKKSRVWERIKAENPGLLDGEVSYQKSSIKGEIDKAVEDIEKDAVTSYRKAMGFEPAPQVEQVAKNIVLAEKALESGDNEAYAKLIKQRTLAQTERGKAIVQEKASVTNNTTDRYVKQVIRDRLDNISKRVIADFKSNKFDSAQKVIKKEVEKIKKVISSKRLSIQEAQDFIDKLACK